MILTNLDISSKEKCLTGLHQNQNFGQVALEFYLAEALSNLPEFGSYRLEVELTFEHNVAASMKSSGELISQCSDPFLNTIQIYSF